MMRNRFLASDLKIFVLLGKLPRSRQTHAAAFAPGECPMNLLRHPILIIALVLCGSCVASIGQSNPTSPEMKVKGIAVYSSKREYCSKKDQAAVTLCEAGNVDSVIVEVEGLSGEIKNGINPHDFVFFL